MADIHQIYIENGNDNYNYLLHCGASGMAAVVDPSEPAPIIEALEQRGWTLSHIINTHHHWDHTGANLALKQKYGAKVIGPRAEADKIPGLDVAVGEGDLVMIGQSMSEVIEVPGHTLGHIAYHFKNIKALFIGDALFSLGCGRMFEGDPVMYWNSLSKLLDLPDDTRVFCAHEYSLANARFAVTLEPENQVLQARISDIEALRAAGKPTVPSLLGQEKAANPFLRPMSQELQETLGMVGAKYTDIFAETRARKDRF